MKAIKHWYGNGKIVLELHDNGALVKHERSKDRLRILEAWRAIDADMVDEAIALGAEDPFYLRGRTKNRLGSWAPGGHASVNDKEHPGNPATLLRPAQLQHSKGHRERAELVSLQGSGEGAEARAEV